MNLVKVTWKAKLFLFIACAVSHHLLPMVTSWFFLFLFLFFLFFFFVFVCFGYLFILFSWTYISIFWNIYIYIYIYISSSNLASRFVTHIKITPNSKIKNKVSLQINLEKNFSNFSYIYIYLCEF